MVSHSESPVLTSPGVTVGKAVAKRRFRVLRRPLPLWLALVVLSSMPALVSGQDPFEIQVYEYETVPKGMWNLETHINYVGRGTREFEGPVAPTEEQLHLTFELTRGITDHFEMAVYQVLAHRPDGGFDYVGWRLRPRVMIPIMASSD